MILDSKNNTVTTVGDIKENSVRIDSNNIEHIIMLLSTNLYSNPVESFLRETISNAVDSTIEAGNNEPVILKFSNCDRDSNQFTVTIRDYGTGISPEKFEEIYLSIGASTKRTSNEYLGCFGIGRFSCLACADSATIKSYYDGIEYCYVMVRNGNKINIDLLYQSPTAEPNGVSVSIVSESLYTFKNALSRLVYFPNLYIDISDVPTNDYYYSQLVDSVNDLLKRKVIRYNTFYISDTPKKGWNCDFNLVIGNVMYAYDLSKILPEPEYYDKFRDTIQAINPVFKIGELDITPNREQLLYSDKTKSAIRKRLFEVIDEVVKIFDEQHSSDFTNIIEYGYNEYNSKSIMLGEYKVPVKDCDFTSTSTYNGEFHSKQYMELLIMILKSCPTYFYHVVYGGFCKSGRYKKGSYSAFNMYEDEHTTKIYLCNGEDLNGNNFKRYLGSLGNGIVIEKCSLKRALKFFNAFYTIHPDNIKCFHHVIYDIYKYIAKNGIEITKDATYEEWLKNNKKKRIATISNVDRSKCYNLYCYYNYLSGISMNTYKFTFEELTTKAFQYCDSYNHSNTIFYTLKDSDELQVFLLLKNLGKATQVVAISKELYAYVEKHGLKGWINFNKILNPNSKIITRTFSYYYYTQRDLYKEYGLKVMRDLIPYVKKEDKDSIYKLYNGYKTELRGINNNVCMQWYNEFLAKGKLDTELTESYNTLLKYIKIYKRLKNLMLLFGDGSIMLAWVAMKNHLIRLNFDSYSKVKSLYKLNNDENN